MYAMNTRISRHSNHSLKSQINKHTVTPVQNFCRDLAEISPRMPRLCRDLRRHYHLAKIAKISPSIPRSRCDLKKTLSSRRDCRDLAETAEIASRLPRSRRDRAKIYGDSNISPRLPRSRRDRAAISPKLCRDFIRRHYHLAEIVPRCRRDRAEI